MTQLERLLASALRSSGQKRAYNAALILSDSARLKAAATFEGAG